MCKFSDLMIRIIFWKAKKSPPPSWKREIDGEREDNAAGKMIIWLSGAQSFTEEKSGVKRWKLCV